jgi:predicted transcriptional regulator of viral defense system
MGYLDLYKNLLQKEVFRVNEIYEYTNNKQVALNLIQLLLRKKLIRRIKHRFYYTVPLELIDKEFIPNPYLIASKLTKGSLLSHYTALELHGLAQTTIHTSYISVPFNRKSFTFKNHKYIFVKNTNQFGIINKKINDTTVCYTDVERTFLECLKTLKYCISLEVFLKSFDNIRLDFKKIEQYLKLINNKSLYQKTGYILSLLKKDLEVPDELLNKLRKNVSTKTDYLETKTKGLNKKNREWNLMKVA